MSDPFVPTPQQRLLRQKRNQIAQDVRNQVNEFKQRNVEYQALKTFQANVIAHIISKVVVVFQEQAGVFVATLWLDVPSGTPRDPRRDSARIVLTHLLALALSSLDFFEKG